MAAPEVESEPNGLGLGVGFGAAAADHDDETAVSPHAQGARPSLHSMHAPSPPLHGAADTAADLMPAFSSISSLDSLSLRADPDAQATVTDFLDFTEYLPSDITRSLTLIGKLDGAYIHASTRVHELTALWGRLPTTPPSERPSPAKLRAEISESLNRGMSSRVYAHAEAVRMAENTNRHYHRAQTILEKLKTMLENYAEAEQQQQEQLEQQQRQQQQQQQQQQREQEQKHQQQQLLRGGSVAGRGQKSTGTARVHRQRVLRITVPGEVLAPYDMEPDMLSDDSDISSTSEDDETPPRQTGVGPGRLKGIKAMSGRSGGMGPGSALKPPKIRAPRAPRAPGEPYLSTSSMLAKLKPPPENAVIGSADAPWLQLTQYELAKLRKRMKKNAQWTPSVTMIARELKALGRNLEAYNEAKKRAEDDGRPFAGALPEPVLEADGVARAPLGALSVDAALDAEHKQLSNRGMKLNEAKKMKNNMAQQAAQDAEESTRKFYEHVRHLIAQPGYNVLAPGVADPTLSAGSITATRATTPLSRKRKRDNPASETAAGDTGDKTEGSVDSAGSAGGVQRQIAKRVKTETPVPIPQHAVSSASSASGGPAHETPVHPPTKRHSTTPVPAPVVGGSNSNSNSNSSSNRTSTSPLFAGTTTTLPVKPPAETPILPPLPPVLPPVRELRGREAGRKEEEGRASRASSRATTPVVVVGPGEGRRPPSRGASVGEEATLASERPRRASTARTTPGPEGAGRPGHKRVKRPAPGVISLTNSGGSAAVGRRKAATRKKRRSQTAGRKGKERVSEVEVEAEGDVEVEVDDEGNVIDPGEPRYCVCNRVSFSTMIQCDNVENCGQEWFHLECVGLTAVPARTTKWYCPDCRVLLNIGEKGEVSARGVRM